MHVCAKGLVLQRCCARTCKSNNVFVSGNDGNLFEIDPNTGNVSMQKEANTLATITLTVLVKTPSPSSSSSLHIQSWSVLNFQNIASPSSKQAAQKSNSFQATSTSVSISVLAESLHPPQFQKPRYQGAVTGVGTMALDMKNEPLRFLATDGDYNATEVTQKLCSHSQQPCDPLIFYLFFQRVATPTLFTTLMVAKIFPFLRATCS